MIISFDLKIIVGFKLDKKNNLIIYFIKTLLLYINKL